VAIAVESIALPTRPTLHGPPNLYFDLAWTCAQLGDARASVQAYGRGLALGDRPQPALQELMAVLRSRSS
jgi:hypothetical protein